MNTKQFLVIGGIILLLIALLGFFGVIGPTAADSAFGETWFFDNGQNWAHTIVGVLALILAFAAPAIVQKWVVVLIGIIGVLLGVYSIFTPNFLGLMLQNPTDTILYFIIGIWALLAAFMGRSSEPSTIKA